MKKLKLLNWRMHLKVDANVNVILDSFHSLDSDSDSDSGLWL